MLVFPLTRPSVGDRGGQKAMLWKWTNFLRRIKSEDVFSWSYLDECINSSSVSVFRLQEV